MASGLGGFGLSSQSRFNSDPVRLASIRFALLLSRCVFVFFMFCVCEFVIHAFSFSCGSYSGAYDASCVHLEFY